MKDGRTFVKTVKNRCRLCYTCVRECPVKAIRIVEGQAEILDERCINCGNCVMVCSQGAKEPVSSVEKIYDLLDRKDDKYKTVAIVAPSFPAEFHDYKDPASIIGMLKELGFDLVVEVAFGADLVANEYKKIFDNDNNKKNSVIVANCPAIISFIELYHPDLVNRISDIVSPMIATARVVKEKYGENCKIAFIGPCISKAAEATDPLLKNEVNDVLTFREIRKMFEEKKILPKSDKVMQEFDPPIGGKGAIFPITRGMLQSVNIKEDLTEKKIMIAEGRTDFPDLINEYETGALKDYHLDLLCCNGCIMGAGMSVADKRFFKRDAVSKYVKKKLSTFDKNEWERNLVKYSDVSMTRTYNRDDQRLTKPPEIEIDKILKNMGKLKKEDELDCEACGYKSCWEHAIAIYEGFAEKDMCLPYTIDKLHNSIDELKTTKDALHQSEKLASMGQLAAGIAHEVNNPLGVVLLYSKLMMEDIEKNSELYSDVKIISEHADRCKNIVSGLLNFSRKNEVNYKKVDICKLMREIIKETQLIKTIKLSLDLKIQDCFAEIDVMQMRQVFTNLIKNAAESIEEDGEIVVTIEGSKEDIIFKITDNGTGIKKKNMDKLFVPFFTTKPAGKGTGLGLPVSYGIIKMHRGKITVKSNGDETVGKTGTEFKIEIPRNNK